MPNQEESPFRGLITSWPALAAMAITILSFMATKPNLESPRPTNVVAVPKVQTSGFDVPARLWQDPLGNLQDAPPQADLTHLRNGAPSREDANAVLILLVRVPPYMETEQVEMRRRERFATLAALDSAGYAPVKADVISYADFSSEGSKKTVAGRFTLQGNFGQNGQLRVAFEWLWPVEGSSKPDYRAVCVIWLPGEINPQNALASLASIKKTIGAVLKGKCVFAITGRLDSNDLETMYKDDKSFKNFAKDGDDLKDVVLYVTQSTAKRLRNVANDSILPNSRLQVKYVIGSDRLLMNTLVSELKNRGISREDDRIALIAEWDTSYGRAMHKEFHSAIRAAHNLGDEVMGSHVILYSYLRGLDGKLPGKTDAAADDKSPDKDAKSADGSANQPGAQNGEGDAQVDYLRRLVERMKAEEKPFRAIGVVGSDPYDKLLILRALRASFPQAVFFTTDLDVRLLQPADFAATRNLVIASHFGLTLSNNLQDQIPPFRSSYDTSSYLGCLLAVKYARVGETPPSAEADGNVHRLTLADGTARALPVHLFEVGRYGAYELTSYTEEKDPLGARNYRRGRNYVSEHWKQLAGVALCVVLLGLLFATVSRTSQRLLSWQRPQETALFTAALIVAALLAGMILYSQYHPNEEPFSMVAGLSLWPTILFRVFAIGLCVYYFFKTIEHLARRDEEIRAEFSLPLSVGPEQPIPSLDECRWLPTHWRHSIGMWFWSPVEGKEHVAQVWQQFEEFGRTRNRLYRCAVVLTINLALFSLLFWLLDSPEVRGRGELARVTGLVTRGLAGLGLISLLVFVVDSTLLCYRFVTYLGRRRCHWPDELLARHAEKCGLTLTAAENDPARRAIDELLRIRLIAAVTDVVARLIFDPFVVLVVMVVAQSPLFIAWQWNLPQYTVLFLAGITALACAVVLQRSARDARTKAIEELDQILAPLGGEYNETRQKVAQIRTEIHRLRSGVYAPFAQNPIFHALILPLGGGGGLAVLQAFLPQM